MISALILLPQQAQERKAVDYLITLVWHCEHLPFHLQIRPRPRFLMACDSSVLICTVRTLHT